MKQRNKFYVWKTLNKSKKHSFDSIFDASEIISIVAPNNMTASNSTVTSLHESEKSVFYQINYLTNATMLEMVKAELVLNFEIFQFHP